MFQITLQVCTMNTGLIFLQTGTHRNRRSPISNLSVIILFRLLLSSRTTSTQITVTLSISFDKDYNTKGYVSILFYILYLSKKVFGIIFEIIIDLDY